MKVTYGDVGRFTLAPGERHTVTSTAHYRGLMMAVVLQRLPGSGTFHLTLHGVRVNHVAWPRPEIIRGSVLQGFPMDPQDCVVVPAILPGITLQGGEAVEFTVENKDTEPFLGRAWIMYAGEGPIDQTPAAPAVVSSTPKAATPRWVWDIASVEVAKPPRLDLSSWPSYTSLTNMDGMAPAGHYLRMALAAGFEPYGITRVKREVESPRLLGFIPQPHRIEYVDVWLLKRRVKLVPNDKGELVRQTPAWTPE